MTEKIKASDFLKSYAIDTSSRRGLRAVELKSKPQAKRKHAQKVMQDGFKKKDGKYILTVGIVTLSELNRRGREHWTERSTRAHQQRHDLRFLWKKYLGNTSIIPPVHVHLTRYAPKATDEGDNLPSCVKSVVDEICALLGVDDGDTENFKVTYGFYQSKEYGVQIVIQSK